MHQFCANIRYNSVFINTRISVSSLKCFTIPASSSLYLHDCTGNQFRKQNKSTSINKNSLAEFDIFPVFVWWGAKQNKHQRSDQRVCLPACRDEYSLLRWNASVSLLIDHDHLRDVIQCNGSRPESILCCVLLDSTDEEWSNCCRHVSLIETIGQSG